MRASLRHALCDRHGPRAACTADSAGGLTFDVVLPTEDERWDTALLLRRGGPAGEDAAVRLPLFPCGAGRLRASLPSTMMLAEGSWNAYLAVGEEAPRRLRSGQHDLRSLLERDPSGQRAWLGVRIPYATRQSCLALRAWLRWPHAEARYVRPDPAGLACGGRLYGADLGETAVLEARRTVPGDPAAPGEDVVGVAVAGRGTDFRCFLPYAAMSGPGEWELWLRTSAGSPVRLARILDDVADKHRVLRYPAQRSGAAAVTPYWSEANDLALRVTPSPTRA
ncbi:hypothetical protein [Streptomyces sp. TR06-5]|uniref:hypothetical protein n=1 Tax=unclassified Streptomyces TaxID=2593676 RepID=UPI0039A37E3D